MLPFYMPESENRSRTRNVQNRSTHSEQHGTHSSKQWQVVLAPRREPWQFKNLRAEVSTTQLDFHWRIRWAFRTNFGVEILPECATTATPSVPMQLFQPKPADHTCAKVKNLMHRCADQRVLACDQCGPLPNFRRQQHTITSSTTFLCRSRASTREGRFSVHGAG